MVNSSVCGFRVDVVCLYRIRTNTDISRRGLMGRGDCNLLEAVKFAQFVFGCVPTRNTLTSSMLWTLVLPSYKDKSLAPLDPIGGRAAIIRSCAAGLILRYYDFAFEFPEAFDPHAHSRC